MSYIKTYFRVFVTYCVIKWCYTITNPLICFTKMTKALTLYNLRFCSRKPNYGKYQFNTLFLPFIYSEFSAFVIDPEGQIKLYLNQSLSRQYSIGLQADCRSFWGRKLSVQLRFIPETCLSLFELMETRGAKVIQYFIHSPKSIVKKREHFCITQNSNSTPFDPISIKFIMKTHTLRGCDMQNFFFMYILQYFSTQIWWNFYALKSFFSIKYYTPI